MARTDKELKALIVVYLKCCDENGTPLLDTDGNQKYYPFIPKEPSKYNGNISSIVDMKRNTEGKLVGSFVRDDIAKVSATWNFMTAKEYANLLQCFTNNKIIKIDYNTFVLGSFTNRIKFFNQESADYDVRTFYVSDRSAAMFKRDCNTGCVQGWTGVQMSFIEV